MAVLTVEEETDGFIAPERKRVSDPQRITVAPAGAVTARFHGYDLCDNLLLSDVPGLSGEVVIARTTVPLPAENAGCSVVILFEQGDLRRPIVIGALERAPSSIEVTAGAGPTVSVQVDNDRLVLRADREIVLCCGQASITLTRAGKVLIQGAYVSSRSSGVNRIKGGSVQIN